ncbi:winged helix-turn-helix domain-containing protein [Rheinheimera sp. 4Y26]|uniref:winged helix-turn-helix domain-containing protein n=1 Tax=Rheinheimera sp. 4Y26 TaxID=2977811 RepID=UPI0021B13581|nr:winged helix-turn-helix domain-containing protein [Rheinheimera sp. 4Y26]MCT6699830.1 winged helix-turn-helix domain-containing protein [Rheinheimera sp. 4Y26]
MAIAALRNGFSLNGQRILPSTGEVFLTGSVQKLEPKVMEVLLVLASSAGDAISAEQIFALVWPRSVYSPVAIRRSVNQLRNVFHDHHKLLIKTHPKRGYSLHADIALLTETSSVPLLPVAEATKTATQPVSAGRAPWWFSIFCLLLCGGCWGLYAAFGPADLPAAADAKAKWVVADLQPLTATKEQESFSQFTPDGKAIVYLKEATASGHSELWLAPTNRQQHRLLYQTEAQIKFFNFAPASTGTTKLQHSQLVIATEQDNSLHFASLWLSDDYQLYSSANHFSLSGSKLLSPFVVAEHQLYFLALQQGEQRLLKADLSSGQVDLLYVPTQQFSPYRIAPAADNNYVTLLGFDEEKRSQIKLFAKNGTELTDYKTLDANWYFIVYHPTANGYLLSDGKALFYLNNNKELSRLAFENYAFLHYPVLSPDGKLLSYSQAKITGNIYSLDLLSHQQTQLTSATAHDWQGSYSPDGKRIAYVSNKNGLSQIFVLDLEANTEQLVYPNPALQLALSQPLWSPDGTKLAFARNERLALLDLNTPQVKVRYFDTVIGQPSQWLPQPERLLLVQKSQQLQRWIEFDFATEQQKQSVSAEHRLYHQNQRYQINKQQLQDATGLVLFQAPKNKQILRHVAKHNGVYLLLSAVPSSSLQLSPLASNPDQSKADAAEIWFFAFAGQNASKISNIPLSGQSIAAIDISDINAQQLLYSTFAVEKDIHTLRLLQ